MYQFLNPKLLPQETVISRDIKRQQERRDQKTEGKALLNQYYETNKEKTPTGSIESKLRSESNEKKARDNPVDSSASLRKKSNNKNSELFKTQELTFHFPFKR